MGEAPNMAPKWSPRVGNGSAEGDWGVVGKGTYMWVGAWVQAAWVRGIKVVPVFSRAFSRAT
jgi:hypothetical protein